MDSEQDTPQLDGEALERIARDAQGQIAEQIGAVLGRGVEVCVESVATIAREKVAPEDEPIVDVSCWLQCGDSGQEVHLLADAPDALRIAALQMGEPVEGAGGPLDAERCTAFKAAARCLVDAIATGLSSADLGTLEARDAREIPEPASDPTWLCGSNFLALRVSLEIESCPKAEVRLLFSSSDAEESVEESAPGKLAFLSDKETPAEQIEEIGAALGLETATFGIAEVDPTSLAESDLEALIVPFEVDGRSGLELVESLRRRGVTTPLIVASEAPTRRMVEAALAAGAASFAMRPYDADELRARLDSLPDETAPASEPE